jgi:hypothetical protein
MESAIAGAGVYVGQQIIILIPAGVELLKHFTENRATNAIVFCPVLVTLSSVSTRGTN